MGFSGIRQKVNENIGVVIGMVAVLIMAGMTVADRTRATLFGRNQHIRQLDTSRYYCKHILGNLFPYMDGQAVLILGLC